MIKFIASDLDGTLLDDEKRLPGEIFDLIEQLGAHGILFAPASGRQYANLKKLFAPVANRIVFIAENGALVVYRGEVLRRSPLPPADVETALRRLEDLPHVCPLLSGEQCAYLADDDPAFLRESLAAYTECRRVESLTAAARTERISKIAVYDPVGAERSLPLLRARLPELRVIHSGRNWCDIALPETDKGAGIRAVRERFGLLREECIAFGDHMNDLDMLAECGHAYVTENCYPPLKQIFPDAVPSNNEGGVITKIKELIGARPHGAEEKA